VKQGLVDLLHAVLWDPGKGPYHYAKALAVRRTPAFGVQRGYGAELPAADHRRARGSKYDWVEEKKTDFGNRFEATARAGARRWSTVPA
jgi:hypothetical protein